MVACETSVAFRYVRRAEEEKSPSALRFLPTVRALPSGMSFDFRSGRKVSERHLARVMSQPQTLGK